LSSPNDDVQVAACLVPDSAAARGGPARKGGIRIWVRVGDRIYDAWTPPVAEMDELMWSNLEARPRTPGEGA